MGELLEPQHCLGGEPSPRGTRDRHKNRALLKYQWEEELTLLIKSTVNFDYLMCYGTCLIFFVLFLSEIKAILGKGTDRGGQQ